VYITTLLSLYDTRVVRKAQSGRAPSLENALFRLWTEDVHGKPWEWESLLLWKSHGNGNKTRNWEWETTSMGMGITCTPWEIL